MSTPAHIVAAELGRTIPKDRERFLKELIGHAAGALIQLKGHKKAAEDIYQLADAMVTRIPHEPS